MNSQELLAEVVSIFDRIEIPYAITGALASSYYGVPRSTHDFDIIINLMAGTNAAKGLIKAFDKDFYVSEEGIIDSVVHGTMFNLIHHQTGIKIDCWILKEDAFSREAFKRRQKHVFDGKQLCFVSVEDLVLNKLLWYKASGSERQLNDVHGVLDTQRGKLDLPYLKKWAIKLKIDDILLPLL